MTSDSLNLPPKLREEAEKCAASQGVSLNQFILWAVAEKVGVLSQHFDDSAFPNITYHRGGSGLSVPIVKGTGVRVQTLAIASQKWGLSAQEIAAEYNLSEEQVNIALAFYGKHRQEIDEAIASEVALESTYNV